MAMIEQYKQLLKDFVAFQSVSTDTQFQPEIQKTVAWLQRVFEQNGFSVQIITGYDNPLVIASFVYDPALETVLIYGHYDVQPAKVDEGWTSDPFTLTEMNRRLVGRGAIDNKGQVLVHMVNVFEHIKSKTLGYNVKFMIEGNEETGSPLLEQFIASNSALLAADFVLISDGEISGGKPNIGVGLRGGLNSVLTVKTSTTDLHSGLYGHSVPNAIHELSKVCADLYDANNRIVVPGFYDDVDSVSDDVKKANQAIPFSLEEHKRISGAKILLTEPGIDFYTQVGLLPAIEVTTIVGGYMGQGFRNGIPATATAKINFRLVAHQNPTKIAKAFEKYVRSILPAYVDFTFEFKTPYNASKIDTKNKYVERAQKVLEVAYGSTPIYKYVGGGLPMVNSFEKALKIPSVLVPLANEDCAMHAANENFALTNVEQALRFSALFLGK